jgi:putative ABC transport system permease protein
MLAHLFKLIWNKKKENFLLMLEMLVSFAVIFAVFTLLVYSVKNYLRPAGFDYKNVWVTNYQVPSEIKSPDSIDMALDALRKNLLSMPHIKDVSISSSNVPFSMNKMNSAVSFKKNKDILTDIYDGEPSYKDLLNLEMISGRWFTRADINSKIKPGVINVSLKDKLFGQEEAVGKEISLGDKKIRIVGVVNDFKSNGDYQVVDYGLYKPMDSTDYRMGNSILIKVTPDAGTATEAKLYKVISNFSRGRNIEIEHLDEKRADKNKMTLIPMIVLLVVSGFLIINVALGLFGVLWYNINKRRGEIGLRRAIGASGNMISKQLVAEAMVLSTFSLVIGSFFAVQFPLLNVFDLPANVYFIALICSIAFIYILVTLCAVYPGKQAAAIYPAVALHEE